MAVGNDCVADPLDTVHHEMDSVVCGCYVYISVWSPVIEQLILEKDPANSHDELADRGFSDGGPHFEKLFTDHVEFYYMKGFVVCHITGRRKEKGLEVPYKYIYYYGSTKDPVFIQDLNGIYFCYLLLLKDIYFSPSH